MFGSLADTALDLVASLETLAAMFQVVLISISAFGLAVCAIQQWIADGRTAEAQDGIVVSAIALAATLALLAYQRQVIARTSSLAIVTGHVQSATRRCSGTSHIPLCRTGSARW